MEGPRGAEPMGVGAGPEGGTHPLTGPAPFRPFPGDPTARTQTGCFSTCSGFAAAPSLFSEPLLPPSTKMGWESRGDFESPSLLDGAIWVLFESKLAFQPRSGSSIIQTTWEVLPII